MISTSELEQKLTLAKEKALRALAAYKFYLFGYYAARWVTLNQLDKKPRINPFGGLVRIAREWLNEMRFPK